MQKVVVRTRSIPRRSFTAELLRSLHALSDRMLSEDIEHFRMHAETNEVVHVYERADTGAPVGFQFWRTAAMDLRDCRVVIGGKLRIEPEFRRRALHLRSAVRFYFENQLRHPGTRFYFLAVGSLFGFVSIASALADYRLFDPSASDAEGRAIRRAFEAQAAQNHHRLDEVTGLFAVGIKMTEHTLAQYSPAYFDRPEARAYIRVNPGWRDNGYNVGFWFRFTPANLARLASTIVRKRVPQT
jgi:hypothetical protein